VDQDRAVASDRLSHFPEYFGDANPPATEAIIEIEAAAAMLDATPTPLRRPALALTAEGPRRADLVAWASAHIDVLTRMRLLAPAGIGALLAEHVGLTTQPLRSGTIGPAATAGLAAAGDIDAMIAFSDPIELRAGDNTTRSLTRLAIFWDIPIAANRATADLLLATVLTAHPLPPADLLPADGDTRTTGPARGAVSLWTVRATVDDVPGRLAILAASLARRAINILSVQVHLTPAGPVDELLVAVSPVLSASDLTAAVIDGGGRNPRVAVADAHALVDAPTRALTLATRLIRTPDDLPGVLASLLPGVNLAWRAEAPAEHADNLTQLWLTDPNGGGFLLTRPAVPFTPAECARAFAMMDVAMAALVPGGVLTPARPETSQLVLADGAELTIRRASPDDYEAVVELHTRCSLTSCLRRYLAGTRCPSEATLNRLLSADAGHALVAEDDEGRIVAMANLMWDGGHAELAVLVEDSWQQRRLGTVLSRRLFEVATSAGVSSVRAVVHTTNTAMVRIMSGLAHRLHREYDGGLLTLIATVTPTAHRHRSPSSSRLAQSGFGIELPT
jgi:methylglyoxal synthase